MPKLAWDESFSVGNLEIDGQHQRWIEIINELHDALMGIGPNNREVDPGLAALKEMKAYGLVHFVAEEAFMQSINYPEFSAHKKAHDAFIRTLDKSLADMENGELVLKREIMSILQEWLTSHILSLDKQYAAFASEQPER